MEDNAESVGDHSQRFQRCILVGDVDPASLVTPKAFASSSPGLEQPWVRSNKNEENAESVGDHSQRFQRCILVGDVDPGLSLRSNPGLELANAFGVKAPLKLVGSFGVGALLRSVKTLRRWSALRSVKTLRR